MMVTTDQCHFTFGYSVVFCLGTPKADTMKAYATLKNFDSETCKPIIVRNLNRILDIRIIDIDVENGILHFLYNGQKALESVKKELCRIGYPIHTFNNGIGIDPISRTENTTHSPVLSMG